MNLSIIPQVVCRHRLGDASFLDNYRCVLVQFHYDADPCCE